MTRRPSWLFLATVGFLLAGAAICLLQCLRRIERIERQEARIQNAWADWRISTYR